MPVEVNEFLNKLCVLRGIKKAEIIREALLEYAERHKGDIAKWV